MASMTLYMRTAADANSTHAYLPKTQMEKAGCPGTGTAVTTDPNYTFASTITPGNERVAYPTGGGGGGAYITTVAAVETTATLLAPYDPVQAVSPYAPNV
jgi:hypothetical protein